ncbi:MAG: ABC transporter permease [Gemmatimonadota bacterium]
MLDWLHELRLAARSLRNSPGILVIAVVTMALGIGATTFMFSIVYGALYRGLPFADGDRIMRVTRANPGQGIERMGVTIHEYDDWRKEQHSFQDLAAAYTGTVNLSGIDRPLRLDGAFITANGISVLGVRPFLGRIFRPGEDAAGQPPLIVLSYQVWKNDFGSDPGVVGRAVRVNGEPSEIIGVMPEGFAVPELQEAWVPLRMDPLTTKRGEGTQLTVYGRLRDGVSLAQAQAEFATLGKRQATEYPDINAGIEAHVASFTEMGGDTAALLLTMLAAVGLILLVACTNVANLLLARTSMRTRALAIRTAVGARRSRIIGGLVAEAMVLAAVGAVLGTAIAWAGMRVFDNAVASTDPPFWFVFAVDGPILVFVVGITLVAAVAAGLLPGIKASGADVQAVLQDESRGASSMRMGKLSRGLVVGELALSVGLLIVAGLMTKGILEKRALDPPFYTDDVFTARIGLFPGQYPDTASRQRFYTDLLRGMSTQPGIEGATLTTFLPGLGSSRGRVGVQGVAYATDQDYPEARLSLISPGFFQTFGTKLARGRDFTVDDRRGSNPVAIVNESFAKQIFGDQDPVGRQIRLGDSKSTNEWRTIVGVAPDMVMQGLNQPEENPRGLYLPLAQADAQFISIAVRTRGNPMAAASVVRREVQALSPDTPLYWTRTLRASIDQMLWAIDIFGGIFIIFGIAALVLAIAGLYGVMAFTVGRRTHEVGIRMALGASARNVLAMILRQGAFQIGIGLAIGLGLAVGLARLLREVLYMVKPWDPWVYALVSLGLAAAALLASAIPARRASRLDPAGALHTD